jgi:hypothetical protein
VRGGMEDGMSELENMTPEALLNDTLLLGWDNTCPSFYELRRRLRREQVMTQLLVKLRGYFGDVSKTILDTAKACENITNPHIAP